MEPREIDTRVVSVKRPGGLSVLLSFSDDYDRLRLVMVLNTLKEGQTPPTETLMGLMDANRQNTAEFYAYNKTQRRTELHRLIQNSSMTPDRLKTELGSLARIAEQSKQLWAIKTPTPSSTAAAGAEKVASTPKPAPTIKPQATPTTNASTSTHPLIGRWAASRSKTEAFALQISQDRSFALVTVVGGKTTKATGKYTLIGSKLTLTDTKGTRIAGTVTLRSTKEFNFLPTGAKTPLTFKKPS